MQLNENIVINIIKKYHEGNSKENIKIFQENVFIYVSNWPKKQYLCNEDICFDFVLYIVEHTEEIIKSYPVDIKVAFTTWFNAVLYNKFCDFSKKGSVPSQDFVLGGELLDNQIGNFVINHLNDEQESNILWEELVQELSPIDRSLWLLYYMPQHIDANTLHIIMKFTNKSLPEIMIYYQEILKAQYNNYQQKEFYLKMIDKIDHTIAHIENIIIKNINDSDKEYKEKILRLKNKQYKYSRSLKRLTNNVFKVFIKFFKDYNTAYRIIKKINLQMKKVLMIKNIV
ncbi:MAG: hypothetical protein KFW21_05675 [Spirochaetota bacterium]|nr:hypothetical protein [Spirochaetota bacterium]